MTDKEFFRRSVLMFKNTYSEIGDQTAIARAQELVDQVNEHELKIAMARHDAEEPAKKPPMVKVKQECPVCHGKGTIRLGLMTTTCRQCLGGGVANVWMPAPPRAP
ncbi:hypothetical protein AH6C_064 [Aeromonas phage pAh6-C]|uniref:Uncharacterized protein n=1 Tax=Aeromonas phage pAh6-C TaxID=1505227 RepID=A0A076G4L3_9CAUD|nr:hypothetical protein AH6C_064 [Aeromonas phage pAh6-C]AII26818.1 hypothetical protein AH6C_064 [Aeromonas phage pAh6-C]